MFVFNKKIWRKLSLYVSLGIKKNCWRGKWAIRRSCIHFSSTVMFTITLQWKNLMLIFTGNNAREFSHFFGRCTTPTLHLAKIRHPWLAEAPESSIWNNLLWIFHCSHSLERSFGTPNAYNYQKFRSRAHPARMQLYYLTDLRFTLDLKYCSYEYSFSRSLEWSSGNHNAHKLPKSRTLSIKVFFLPKQKSSKEEMKQGGKKYLSAAKITIHILLRSREFFELHM